MKLKDILAINQIKVRMDIPQSVRHAYNKLNDDVNDKKRKVFTNVYEFSKQRRKIIKNRNPYGIPQGSAISAVLSNVYMIDFDRSMTNFVGTFGGLYMRYSDDFIVVFPTKDDNTFGLQFAEMLNIIKSIPRLFLESKKAQAFAFQQGNIQSRNPNNVQTITGCNERIDYLGFSFDGKTITIRDKTISKYYYRMYRKAKTIIKNNGFTWKGNKISAHVLYEKYSSSRPKAKPKHSDGLQKRRNGNFLTYVKRAREEFEEFGDDQAIDKSTKNHMLKIRRKLDKTTPKQ